MIKWSFRKKQRSGEKNEIPPSGDDTAGGTPLPSLHRLMWIASVLLVCFVLWIGVRFIPHTQMFHHYVAAQVSEKLGLPVSIERIRFDRRFNLNIYNIKTQNNPLPGIPAFHIQNIDIDWRFHAFQKKHVELQRIHVKEVVLSMAVGPDGLWRPLCFAPLTELIQSAGHFKLPGKTRMEASSIPQSSAQEPATLAVDTADSSLHLLKNTDIRVTGINAQWWSSASQREAAISNAAVSLRFTEMDQREVRYCKVSAAQVRTASGMQVDDVFFEILSTDGRNFVLDPSLKWTQKEKSVKVAVLKPVHEKAKDHSEPAPIPDQEIITESVLSDTPVLDPVVSVDAPEKNKSHSSFFPSPHSLEETENELAMLSLTESITSDVQPKERPEEEFREQTEDMLISAAASIFTAETTDGPSETIYLDEPTRIEAVSDSDSNPSASVGDTGLQHRPKTIIILPSPDTNLNADTEPEPVEQDSEALIDYIRSILDRTTNTPVANHAP